jgi:hypothetical protein
VSPTPSPFGSNARRYRKVPKRVKNPKTESGCLFWVSATAATVALVMVASAM